MNRTGVWDRSVVALAVCIAGASFVVPGVGVPARAMAAPAGSCFAICPADTLLRPGRYVDLLHGFTNGTDHMVSVIYAIEGQRWPPPTSLNWDPWDVPPGQTQEFLVQIRAPDSASAGVNAITWGAGRDPGFWCSYRITVPELISSVTAEASVSQVRLSWVVADSSADTAVVYRRDSGGMWDARGEVFASVGSALVFEDHDVVPGLGYDYRLGLPVETRQIYRGEVSAAVPDLLSGASAEVAVGRVLVTWIAADSAAYGARVYRRTQAGSWALRDSVRADRGLQLSYEDRSVTPGVAYGYRLGILVAGREFYRGEVAVVAAIAAEELGLERLSGNPASGPLWVAATLGRGDPARVELFDAGGRRLRTQALPPEPGRSVVDAAGGMRLRPGLYFARLVQGARHRSLRFAVL